MFTKVIASLLALVVMAPAVAPPIVAQSLPSSTSQTTTFAVPAFNILDTTNNENVAFSGTATVNITQVNTSTNTTLSILTVPNLIGVGDKGTQWATLPQSVLKIQQTPAGDKPPVEINDWSFSATSTTTIANKKNPPAKFLEIDMKQVFIDGTLTSMQGTNSASPETQGVASPPPNSTTQTVILPTFSVRNSNIPEDVNFEGHVDLLGDFGSTTFSVVAVPHVVGVGDQTGWQYLPLGPEAAVETVKFPGQQIPARQNLVFTGSVAPTSEPIANLVEYDVRLALVGLVVSLATGSDPNNPNGTLPGTTP